mgnify:CR=1 FL=1
MRAILPGLAVLALSEMNPPLYNTRLIFPFFKNLIPDLGVGYVFFAAFVLGVPMFAVVAEAMRTVPMPET